MYEFLRFVLLNLFQVLATTRLVFEKAWSLECGSVNVVMYFIFRHFTSPVVSETHLILC